MPSNIFSPGQLVWSRKRHLSYEIAADLNARGSGESTCFGVGGDPVVGLDFINASKLFKEDAKTKAVFYPQKSEAIWKCKRSILGLIAIS